MWTIRGGLSRQRNCAEVWKEVWHGVAGEGKLSMPRAYGAWEVMWDGPKAGCRVWVRVCMSPKRREHPTQARCWPFYLPASWF